MNTFASAPPFSSKPRKILYPLPSNECATETVTCTHVESTAWVVLTPLEMIQKIALMAVNSPAFLAHNDSRFQCGRALIETFATDSLIQDNDGHAGQKRKRDCTDDSLEFDDDVDSLATVLESVDIQPSDCSFNSWTPALPVGQTNSSRLDLLVRDFERIVVSSNITWCLPSYNRVQQTFLSDIARAGSDAEARLNVVIRASRQLQALVDSVLPTKNSDLSSKSFDTVTKTKRQSLNFHMMSWVSCNWKNPFPDDEALNYLTNFLIENQSVSLSSKDITRLNRGEPLVSITSEKIDNWLVNARTRKWRPVRDVGARIARVHFSHKYPSSLPLTFIPPPSPSSRHSIYADPHHCFLKIL